MSTRLSDDAVGSIPKGRPTLELLGHRYQSVKLDLTTPSQVHSSLKLFGIWLSSLGSSRRCLQLASVSAVHSIEHAANRRPGCPHAYAEPFAAFPITDYRKSSTGFGSQYSEASLDLKLPEVSCVAISSACGQTASCQIARPRLPQQLRGEISIPRPSASLHTGSSDSSYWNMARNHRRQQHCSVGGAALGSCQYPTRNNPPGAALW